MELDGTHNMMELHDLCNHHLREARRFGVTSEKGGEHYEIYKAYNRRLKSVMYFFHGHPQSSEGKASE